jgi:ribose/xylose/arabinose/galactoside ABC-type transport system permease subunit
MKRLSSGLRPLRGKPAINLMILIGLAIVISLANDNFLDPNNLRNVLRQISVVAIVGAAFTLVMVAGGLDLSIGGVVALSGVVAAMLAVDGMPIPLAFLIGVIVGAFVGFVNGLLIVHLRINSVIATLGTLYVCRGVASLLTDGLPVHGVPEDYGTLGTGFLIGLPIPVLILVVVIVIFTIIERKTILGKHGVAIGSNFEAARLSGIRVDALRVTLYVISGTMAGVGGIILSSRLNSGHPQAALGLEFDVIVAAILGGTSLLGGEGTVIGTALGALIVGVLNNGLNLLGVSTFWQQVVQGIILVTAVGIDILLRESGWSSIRRSGESANDPSLRMPG